jgi:hypothetical protein
MTTTAPAPYAIYSELKRAGWFRNFSTSQAGKGHLYIPVPGAPRLGGGEADRLWSGTWTKPDGTSIFQRSNMDRSVTTIVLDPLGNTLYDFRRATLADAADHLSTLNLV